MRKILFLLSAIMVLLLGLAFFYLRQNPELLMDRLIRKQVAQFNNQASAYLKQPGINIYTVGTATPIPGERAQTCTAIFIDGHFFLFDVGYVSVGKMERMGLPLDQL